VLVYKPLKLPVVLYGCDVFGEHKIQVSKIIQEFIWVWEVPRRQFRILYNAFCYLCGSPAVIRKMNTGNGNKNYGVVT